MAMRFMSALSVTNLREISRVTWVQTCSSGFRYGDLAARRTT